MTIVGRRPLAGARSAGRRTVSMALRYTELQRAIYRSQVADLVARLAPRWPLTQLYHKCQGAFPKVVKESLLDLLPDGSHLHARKESKEPASRGVPTRWEDDELDLIDSQWYFDLSTVGRILSFLPEGARSLTALGAPTVAAVAARRLPEVQLLDISPRFQPGGDTPSWIDLEKVEARRCDLDVKPVSDITRADMVIMDPPWHLENYQAWLQTAVQACMVGGLLAVVLPQRLTNRKAQYELGELHRILTGIGQVGVERDILSYVTPSFELPVLDNDGLKFLRRWRRADLALVRVQRPEVTWESPGVNNLVWSYRRVEGRAVRTWGETAGDAGVPVITPAQLTTGADGYRLASVGRTYLTSSGINLVTSRGRAAIVTRWGRLPRILDLMERGCSLVAAASTALPDASPGDLAPLITSLLILLER